MRKSHPLGVVCACALAFLCTTNVPAAIISEFTDLPTYNAAVGPHTTIHFNDKIPGGAIITGQYLGEGATFNDGDDLIHFDSNFITDGVGLNGSGRIDISFSSLINHIGVEFPGALRIELYLGGSLLDTSSQFAGQGTGFFGGLISTPFDRVVLIDWVDNKVFIDNVHIGATIPIPPALWLFASGLLGLAGIARCKKAA